MCRKDLPITRPSHLPIHPFPYCIIRRLKPPEKSHLPTSRLRRFCYQLVHHKYFDIFILTIILINVGFLAATWYGEPPSYTRQKDLVSGGIRHRQL